MVRKGSTALKIVLLLIKTSAKIMPMAEPIGKPKRYWYIVAQMCGHISEKFVKMYLMDAKGEGKINTGIFSN